MNTAQILLRIAGESQNGCTDARSTFEYFALYHPEVPAKTLRPLLGLINFAGLRENIEGVLKTLTEETKDLPRTHYTQAGESVGGIALRKLGDGNRWKEIVELNKEKFGDDYQQHYYFPVHSTIILPKE